MKYKESILSMYKKIRDEKASSGSINLSGICTHMRLAALATFFFENQE